MNLALIRWANRGPCSLRGGRHSLHSDAHGCSDQVRTGEHELQPCCPVETAIRSVISSVSFSQAAYLFLSTRKTKHFLTGCVHG